MRCLCVVVLLGSAAADDFRKHLARLRQHQDAAAAGLPACEKQCAKGCALCMKKVSGAVLECLRILFNGWIVERIRRAYAAPRRGERVLLKLLEDRVV